VEGRGFNMITINVCTYERYDEIKRCIECFLSQTNNNFILDIWQDGPDQKKKEIVESYKDSKIIYNENPHRANFYGADMRNKSIQKSETKWWMTTNDDNYTSKFFVEKILNNQDEDMIRVGVGMINWVHVFSRNLTQEQKKEMEIKAVEIMKNGTTDNNEFSKYIPILTPFSDVKNKVDAASFIVKTEIMKKVGWHNFGVPGRKFADDFETYSKILGVAPKIKRIDEVLYLHF
jgi:GT2 family glycosyltransferase